jgi:nucleoside 2-deoxyribosyltransferase
MENMTKGFEYSSNCGVITFCGVEWRKLSQSNITSSSYNFPLYKGGLVNDAIGKLDISSEAFAVLNVDDKLHHKVLSLVYEQRKTGKTYSIVSNNEKPINWRDEDRYISCTVDTFLRHFPTSFIDIQQRALLSLYRNYPDYGQHIRKIEHYHFFSKNSMELGFILKALISKQFIVGGVSESSDGNISLSVPFRITVEGFVEIEKSIYKLNSKSVFVAMSFDKSMESIRMSIKRAIEEAGLEPILIDEVEHINYIPLEIQNKIKNSGLLVVELTTQNHGAYFEAGYAMGLNIPIVWCCKDDDKANLHFDIRQYNNILWKNEDELSERLKNRLVAIRGLENNI